MHITKEALSMKTAKSLLVGTLATLGGVSVIVYSAFGIGAYRFAKATGYAERCQVEVANAHEGVRVVKGDKHRIDYLCADVGNGVDIFFYSEPDVDGTVSITPCVHDKRCNRTAEIQSHIVAADAHDYEYKLSRAIEILTDRYANLNEEQCDVGRYHYKIDFS